MNPLKVRSVKEDKILDVYMCVCVYVCGEKHMSAPIREDMYKQMHLLWISYIYNGRKIDWGSKKRRYTLHGVIDEQ